LISSETPMTAAAIGTTHTNRGKSTSILDHRRGKLVDRKVAWARRSCALVPDQAGVEAQSRQHGHDHDAAKEGYAGARFGVPNTETASMPRLNAKNVTSSIRP